MLLNDCGPDFVLYVHTEREILIAFLAAARWHLLVYVYYVTSNILDPSEKTNKDGL